MGVWGLEGVYSLTTVVWMVRGRGWGRVGRGREGRGVGSNRS